MPKTINVNEQGYTLSIPILRFPVPIRFQCCTCGLVHAYILDMDKNNFFISIFRDDWDTLTTRKNAKRKKKNAK